MRISDWSSDVCSSDLLEAAGGKFADLRKAEFAMGGEPVALEGQAFRVQVVEHVVEILQAEMRQQELVMQARAPAHRPAGIGLVPESRPQEIGRATGRERVCNYE